MVLVYLSTFGIQRLEPLLGFSFTSISQLGDLLYLFVPVTIVTGIESEEQFLMVTFSGIEKKYSNWDTSGDLFVREEIPSM